MKTKQGNMDKINSEIASCRACAGLNEPRKTMSAPGYGSLNATYFIIGQSLHSYNPATPDRQIPFVGTVNDSGKILYSALHKSGVCVGLPDPECANHDVNAFITNVVHCHPPGNRTSSSDEISKCSRFLESELEIIGPKIIILIGNDARNWFGLPRLTPVSRGCYSFAFRTFDSKSFPKSDGKIFVIAKHPSYVQRFGVDSVKKTYISDLAESIEAAKDMLKERG